MKKLLLLFVFLLLMTGCSPFFTSSESTKTPRIKASPILQSSQEEPTVAFTAQIPTDSERKSTATVLITDTPQPALPEILRFRPEQIQQESLCPSGDFVPFRDLGIPPNLGLLLTDGGVLISGADESYPLYLITSAIELPGTPLTLNRANTMHSVPIPNSDGKFFYYLEFEKGQPARKLVVQSTDGQMKKIVLERAYPFGRPSWIDNQHIVWMDIPDPDIYWSYGGRPDEWEYIPTHLINVQTLEIQELPIIHFLKKDGYYTVQGFTHSATGNYALLQNANIDQISYEIYSYTTQTSRPVFTWLPAEVFRDPNDTRKNITGDGRLYFIALDGNVFWIVSQVSIDQVLSDPDTLTGHLYEFTFPEAITPSFIPYYFNTRNAFLFTRQNRINENFLEAVPQYLYRFDIDTQTIYDYCFDIQKWRGRADMSISPGEEFAAITLYENPMTGEGKKDTVIINLVTGARTILPDYQAFGWVKVDQ